MTRMSVSLPHSLSLSLFIFSNFMPWFNKMTHKHCAHIDTKHITYSFGSEYSSLQSFWVWLMLCMSGFQPVLTLLKFVFLLKLTVLQELTTTAQYSSLVNLHILTVSCKTYVIAKPEIHWFTVTQGAVTLSVVRNINRKKYWVSA